MKLHDLQPAPGSRTPRTRVGRGIAAGKGKTAGRGTKGQKARAGGSIPPWFEGGQTPIHMRIPKLRGFKNRFKIHYEVVNVGAIGDLAERGAFQVEGGGKASKAAPITINQDILRAVGLVRTLDKPLKILGAGELSTPLFVVADAFTASARTKIEGAGGSVNLLEVPTAPSVALGVEDKEAAASSEPPEPAAPKARAAKTPRVAEEPSASEAIEAAEDPPARSTRKTTTKPSAMTGSDDEAPTDQATGEAPDTTDDAADTTDDAADTTADAADAADAATGPDGTTDHEPSAASETGPASGADA